MRPSQLRILVITALLLVLVGPSTADILVMKDGSQLEIDGEWKEKGRMIEFMLPNGTYGAVRASEVDREASREATRVAQEPAEVEPPPEKKKEPVLVITDKDVASAPLDVIAANQASVTARAIRVTNWSMEPDSNPDVVRMVRGTVTNYGTLPVRDVSITVTVIGNDPAGDDPTLVRQARLESSDLAPGDSTEFELPIRRNDANTLGGPGAMGNLDTTFEVSFQREEPETEETGESEATGETGEADEES